MAPRPNWKGYLKLSLVSCPVALYPATSASDKIALHMVNRETGNRLRRQMVDAETGDVVEGDEIARGYEVSRGEHVILENEELNDVALESTHTIDIETFVPRVQVDERYLNSPYYLVPDDEVGEEAFAVIRDAMKRKNVVGLGRVVLYRRERIVMLEPRNSGILLTTLRYDYEVRQEDDYFDEIPKVDLPKEMLDLAEHIIKTKSGKFDPKKFEDHYEHALVELIRSKQSGKPQSGPKAPPKPSNVVSLMDALKRSVGQSGGGRSTGQRVGRTRAKKRRHTASARGSKRAASGKNGRRTRKAS